MKSSMQKSSTYEYSQGGLNKYSIPPDWDNGTSSPEFILSDGIRSFELGELIVSRQSPEWTSDCEVIVSSIIVNCLMQRVFNTLFPIETIGKTIKIKFSNVLAHYNYNVNLFNNTYAELLVDEDNYFDDLLGLAHDYFSNLYLINLFKEFCRQNNIQIISEFKFDYFDDFLEYEFEVFVGFLWFKKYSSYPKRADFMNAIEISVDLDSRTFITN